MSLIDRLLHSSRSDSKPDGDKEEASQRDVAPSTPPAEVGGKGEDDMQAMLRDFEDIQDAIGADEPTGTGEERIAISMSLSEILGALPSDCVSGTAPTVPEAAVDVIVREPYSQLKCGKVTVEIADLIRNVPNDLLGDEVGNRLSQLVAVPLSKVVTAVSPEEFTKRTSAEEREPTIHNMPDLFDKGIAEVVQEPATAPVGVPEIPDAAMAKPPEPEVPTVAEPEQLDEEPDEPETVGTGEPGTFGEIPRTEGVGPTPAEVPGRPEREEPAEEGEPPPTPTEAEEPDPIGEPEPEDAVVPTLPAAAPVSEERHAPAEPEMPTAPLLPVYVAGLDINSAGADEFVDAFEGVGPKLAQRIVAGRPYASPLGLSKVPGLGRALYQRITGERLPRGHVDMKSVNLIIGEPGHGMPDLKAVARAVANLPGVSGCILSHTDGYLLSQAWKRGTGQSIGAIAPQLFKQVGKYFELLQMEGPESMTLFVDPRPVFITKSGDVFMIVYVSRSRLSARRLTFLEVVTSELMKRLKKGAR